jgi:hypothetical protein
VVPGRRRIKILIDSRRKLRRKIENLRQNWQKGFPDIRKIELKDGMSRDLQEER